jgi:DNA-binding transcriptional ArsR family regulator
MPNDTPMAPPPLRPVQPSLLFHALGNETRMVMLRRLAAGGTLCVKDFVTVTGRRQDAVSRHLRLLLQAGAVMEVPAADGDLRKTCYTIHPSVVREGPGGKELDFGSCTVRL